MNKKLILFSFLILLASIFINVMAGGWISAKLSAIPLFEKYHIFDPQAPIVITRREEVKSADSGEMLDAINKSKSRLSTIASVVNNSIVVTGAAINLSADGYFLTTQQAVAGMQVGNPGPTIILNNGQSAPILQMYGETGTNLVIIKANLSNVPTTEFGSSKDMVSGQKIGFLHNVGSTMGAIFFQESYVTLRQNSAAGKLFDSDRPSRSFGAQSIGGLITGEAVINSDGKVVGMWDGQNLVSSDVISETVRLFFNGGGKLIQRPQWRFAYRNIGSMESGLFQLPVGALVVNVDQAGESAKAGLKAGDIVTAVAGQNVTDDTTLEELLQSRKPGEGVGLTVVRDKKLTTVMVAPGQ